MTVQDALEEKLAELRLAEEERKRSKIAAFKEQYSAEDVSLDQIAGFEVVVLDKQYVIIELQEKGSATKKVSGPGQGEYVPAERWLLGAKDTPGKGVALVAFLAQDLEDLAALALMQGEEFEEITGPFEVILSLSDDVMWRNITRNR